MRDMSAYLFGWSLAFVVLSKEPMAQWLGCAGSIVALIIYMRCTRKSSTQDSGVGDE